MEHILPSYGIELLSDWKHFPDLSISIQMCFIPFLPCVLICVHDEEIPGSEKVQYPSSYHLICFSHLQRYLLDAFRGYACSYLASVSPFQCWIIAPHNLLVLMSSVKLQSNDLVVIHRGSHMMVVFCYWKRDSIYLYERPVGLKIPTGRCRRLVACIKKKFSYRGKANLVRRKYQLEIHFQ